MISKAIAYLVVASILSAGAFTSKANAAETVELNRTSSSGAVVSLTPNANVNATLLHPRGLSVVTFWNDTGLTLHCFANGKYKGFVYPNHYITVYVPSGYVVLAARADFYNAPPLFWNTGLLHYRPGVGYTWRVGA